MEALRKVDETGSVDWGWGNNDATSVVITQSSGLGKHVKSDENSTTADFIDFMTWSSRKNSSCGSATTMPPVAEAIENEQIDRNAEDRITLLSMKYVSSSHTLTPEEDARLKIINHLIDKENPRYTVRDWEALKTARHLIDDLAEL